MLRAPLGAKRGRNVAHHRYINVTLEVGVGPIVNNPTGTPPPPDYQEVVDDLIKNFKAAKKPKNKQDKTYEIGDVAEPQPPAGGGSSGRRTPPP